jgi:hypothetical protein
MERRFEREGLIPGISVILRSELKPRCSGWSFCFVRIEKKNETRLAPVMHGEHSDSRSK